jgi:nucleoside-diphosphate-sugar epimerase
MKTFLITGASTGIGAATARMAVEAGYRVALAARSADKLESLAQELGGPDKALTIACDVASYEDQRKMAKPRSPPSAASTWCSPMPASAPRARAPRAATRTTGARWC